MKQSEAGDTILFCDDNIVSGSQATYQFLAWFGIPRETWPEDSRTEQGINDVALTDENQAKFKKMHIGIAVAVKGPQAPEALERVCKHLEIVNFLGIKSGSDIANGGAHSSGLEAFLSDVGSHILAHARYGKNYDVIEVEQQEKCKADALGYQGMKGLLATAFNVPVSTFVPLWCPGMYKDTPWMPLFIRRGYLRHLVLF